MILVDSIAAAAAAAYVAIGALRWVLGRRAEALAHFESAVNVAVHLIILQLIFAVAGLIASELGLQENLSNASSVREALEATSKVFGEAAQTAISLILYVQTERALLAAAPVTSPLSSVLGAATSWSTGELSIIAILFLHLSFAAKAFSAAAPYLALTGSALLPVPRLRSMGASLLSVYLSVSIALFYGGSIVSSSLAKVKTPSALNPVDWVTIASTVGDAAMALGEAATLCVLALTLAAAAGAGLARVFGGLYVSVLRV